MTLNGSLRCILCFSLATYVVAVSQRYSQKVLSSAHSDLAARPTPPEFCEAKYPFCPGQTAFPATWQETDEIDIFMLQTPVWEFKYGNLMGKFNIFHDAMGLVNKRLGQNFTLEWYELFQLQNCTFPHLVPSQSDPSQLEPLWCNQGAACLTKSIDDRHWTENGTMVQVTTVNGAQFRTFADWVRTDNSTRYIYETWSVRDKPNGKEFFDSYDCADFVIRALRKIASLGGTLNKSVRTRFTRVELYTSKEPELIDPVANQEELVTFYKNFQPSSVDSLMHIVKTVFSIAVHNILGGKFFVYMNDKYYRLHLHWPFVNVRYEDVLI